MKSSLCAAYITEVIYFPLKITQNIYSVCVCVCVRKITWKQKVGEVFI